MSKLMAVAAAVLFTCGTFVLAGQGNQGVSGGKGTKRQIRKRDQVSRTAAPTATKIQQRDRLKDGSCATARTAAPTATKIQQRDRLKDGSCATARTAAPTATKIQQRDRLKDGSCQ